MESSALYYKYIFVILVYKNIEVLKDFFEGFIPKNSHVIVVNSYYNEVSKNECEKTAKFYDASFINVENKGYGCGNNVGCQYAMDNFKFDFLIISNSDIKIVEFNDLDRYLGKQCVISPEVRMLSGKHQNPNIVKFSKWCYYMPLRLGYKYDIKMFVHVAHIYSRLTREIFLFKIKYQKRERRIFSAHGSFFIVTKNALNKLFPLFDEDMFLYNEELYLALKCKGMNVPIIYNPNIKVLHEEGASTPIENNYMHEQSRQSFIILDSKINQI